MSSLHGCDRELMFEISQLEELDCFPNYNLSDTTRSGTTLRGSSSLSGAMAYAMPEQAFENIPVQQWTSQNCVEWAENICYQHSVDRFSVDIGTLSNTTGSHLMQLSLQDFCLMLGDYYGQIFYRELQALIKSNQDPGRFISSNQDPGRFISSPDLDPNNSMNYDNSQDFYDNSLDMYTHNQEGSYSSSYLENSNLYGYSEHSLSFDSSGACGSTLDDTLSDIYDRSFNFDSSYTDEAPDFKEESLENVQYYDLDSSNSIGMLSVDMGALKVSRSPNYHTDFTESRSPNYQTDFSEIDSKSPCQPNMLPNAQRERTTRERTPRRKRIAKDVNVSENTVQELTQNVQGSGKYIRCPKSWEFLMRLIVNSETNPEVICWEDEAHYIFRLIEPRKIVEIWNAKTGKSSGNYDNFARSLRYHYKKGILFPVPEKQLVYRCGPVAIEYLNKLKSQ